MLLLAYYAQNYMPAQLAQAFNIDYWNTYIQLPGLLFLNSCIYSI